jgi:hypothetical protein
MTVMPGVLTQGREVQHGWTPPNHNAVLDSHLTTLYEKAKNQLEEYETALVERKRKAALLSDGKKFGNGHPCVNFVFANNDGTMFCKKRSLTLGWATLKLMRMMFFFGTYLYRSKLP